MNYEPLHKVFNHNTPARIDLMPAGPQYEAPPQGF